MVLGYAWSAPLGLVGVLAAELCYACGWTRLSTWERGALVVFARGPLADWMWARGWYGFTLGWTVFLWGSAGVPMRAYEHELAHVRQALRWGLLLWPAYLACLLVVGYHRNPFEVAARKAAGEVA